MIYLGLAGLAGFAMMFAPFLGIGTVDQLFVPGLVLFAIGSIAFKWRSMAAKYAQQQFFLDNQRRK